MGLILWPEQKKLKEEWQNKQNNDKIDIMSKELDTIKEKIAQNKEYLRKTYGVEEIGVFGSYVRGEDSLLSDVDLLYSINEKKDEKISIFDLIDMKTYLEKILGKTVDIVEKKAIKPLFKNQIISEAVML